MFDIIWLEASKRIENLQEVLEGMDTKSKEDEWEECSFDDMKAAFGGGQ